MAEGPENTIRVKIINLKCGPDTSYDDYIHLVSFILSFWTYSTPFYPESSQHPFIGWLELLSAGIFDNI